MLVDPQELLLELGKEHAKAVACFFGEGSGEYDRGRVDGLTYAIVAVKRLAEKASEAGK